MKFISILVIALFLGCSTAGENPAGNCQAPQIEIQLSQDSSGFVDTEHCDSLLFSGLLSAAGYSVDLEAAEQAPGEWLRKPVSYPECFAEGKSRSTISRDMLLGVYWHAWDHKDLAMLERIWDYGTENLWKMGSGRNGGTDTILNTAMISTLAEMIYQLGGENHWTARNLPTFWKVTEDKAFYYVNRLTALHLALRNEVYGSVSSHARGKLDELARLWPDNPLFAWARGDYCAAGRLVTNPSPPTGIHKDSEYKYERAFVAGRLP